LLRRISSNGALREKVAAKNLFAKLVVRVLLWDTSLVFGFEVLIVEENRAMEL